MSQQCGLTVRTVKIDNYYCPEVKGVEYNLWESVVDDRFPSIKSHMHISNELILEIERIMGAIDDKHQTPDNDFFHPSMGTFPLIRLNEEVYAKDCVVTKSDIRVEHGVFIQTICVCVYDRNLVDRLDFLL